MAKWYEKYLSIYGKSYKEVPDEVLDQIKRQLAAKQNPDPLISIVVIAYNEEMRLAACLWSLSELQTNYPIEILGVNNNSKDRTERVYQRLGLPYFNESKQSPGYARQCGLDHAKGKYHFCIDADTFYPPRYVDLMMTKLPTTICPFTVQMGGQVARNYYNLGKASGDSTCVARSKEILAGELLRYAGYLRFYQTLSTSQYERLTTTDKYIDQQYLLDMMSNYGSWFGDKEYEVVAQKLVNAGVNMDRLQSYQKAYEQQMIRQMQAQQAAANQESSASLEEVLGN